MKKIAVLFLLLIIIFTVPTHVNAKDYINIRKQRPSVNVQSSVITEKGKYKYIDELSWSKIKGADGYKIYKKNSKGKLNLVKTVKNNNSVTFAKKKNTYVTYYVRAYAKKKGKIQYSKYGYNRYVKE